MDFVGMLRALMDERGLGVRALARPFLSHGLIDHVLAHIPAAMPGGPARDTPWPQLPPGFAITSTRRVEGFAQVQAQRPER
jgi:hypothetical protein